MRFFSSVLDWVYWYWAILLIVAVIIFIVGVMTFCIITAPPHVEYIENLACGKLISIRATGSFNIYDTELKFEDGSMLLMTYSFCRRNNLREGESYQIWHSSYYGFQCKLLEVE
ncbi:MAG: hypothetical protein ACTSPI_02285 [Candidatus Heimdallarchaeaceae archaeon]